MNNTFMLVYFSDSLNWFRPAAPDVSAAVVHTSGMLPAVEVARVAIQANSAHPVHPVQVVFFFISYHK